MRRRQRPKPVAGPGGWQVAGAAEQGAGGGEAARGGAAPAESAQFEAYYRLQRVCAEGEWPSLLAALRSSLPAAVRINGGAPVAPLLLERLRQLELAGPEGGVYAPRGLAWYPGGLAWQFDALCGQEISRGPAHARLKARLVWLQGLGALTRQEAVSMVPPLCLGVRPGQLVLDLCAAPGAKASQLLELLLAGGGAGEEAAGPRGAVVANEIDGKRAEVLTHMLNRYGSPAAVAVNLDARYFPGCAEAGPLGPPLRFDRVLADVPCSGDGTLRKSPGLWARWRPREALALHPRQYALLCRGLELLRVGGRLVYSTCSLNPVEDEAVVAAALRRFGGAAALREPPALEGLGGRAGLAEWLVPHPEDGGTCWRRAEEVPAEVLPGLPPSCFAPAPASAEGRAWAEVCARCRRFLPHDARSGGFFVAVLEKLAEAPAPPAPRPPRGAPGEAGPPAAEDAEPAPARGAEPEGAAARGGEGPGPSQDGAGPEGAEGQDACGGAAERGARKRLSRREKRALARPLHPVCDYERVVGDDPAWRDAAAFFGLDPSLAACLWRRCGCEKRLYLASEGAARFLGAWAPFRLRVVQAGVRALERLSEGREGGPSTWRLAQEGLPALLRYGLRRRVAVGAALLRRLLERRELPLADLEAAERAGEARGLEALRRGCAAPASGSLAVELLPAGAPGQAHLAAAALLAGGRLELYVARAEAAALLESVRLLEAPEELLPAGAAAPGPAAARASDGVARGAAGAPQGGPAAAVGGADGLGCGPRLHPPAPPA